VQFFSNDHLLASMAEPENSSTHTNCQPVAPDELLLDVLLELDELLLLEELEDELLEELPEVLELLLEELEDELLAGVLPVGFAPPQAVVIRQDKNTNEMRCTT
jgi:hypothetical protein